jgi:hypothetical protein
MSFLPIVRFMRFMEILVKFCTVTPTGAQGGAKI